MLRKFIEKFVRLTLIFTVLVLIAFVPIGVVPLLYTFGFVEKSFAIFVLIAYIICYAILCLCLAGGRDDEDNNE